MKTTATETALWALFEGGSKNSLAYRGLSFERCKITGTYEKSETLRAYLIWLDGWLARCTRQEEINHDHL